MEQGGAGGVEEPPLATGERLVLQLALRFYGAQRAGDTHNWLLAQFPEEEPRSCFDADGQPEGLDLTGGWFDAGDHIKPTLTIAYSALILLKAYEAFPSAFDDVYGPTDPMRPGGDPRGTPNGIPDVLDEVSVATDYLSRIVVSPTSFVTHVAEAGADHTQFRACTQQDDLDVEEGGEMSGGQRVGRPVSTGRCGHAGGLAAGALALMGKLYAEFDETRAAGYVDAAKAVYAAADAEANDCPGPYSGEKGVPAMLCGAAELYRVTEEESYRADAVRFNADRRAGAHDWVLDYDNPHELCQQSMYLATGDETALNNWRETLLTTVSNEPEVSGLLFGSTWDDWGVLRRSTSAAFSLALFDATTGSSEHRELARSQLAWVMGENPHNRSFIVGFGENAPKNPHHRNACFFNAEEPSETGCRYTLYGALVGGPAPGSGYVDDATDYRLNEVALDYNAGFTGLAAFAAATSP